MAADILRGMRVFGRVFLVSLAAVFTVALLFSLLRRRRRVARPLPQLTGIEPYTGGQSWGPRIAPPTSPLSPADHRRHRPLRRAATRRRTLAAAGRVRRKPRPGR